MRNTLIYVIIMLSVVGCRKFVTIAPSPELLPSELVFTTNETAQAAVNGVYLQLRTGNLSMTSSGLTIFSGLASDELSPTSPTSTTLPFFQNELTSVNTAISTYFYNHAYRTIYQANAILERLRASSAINLRLSNQLKAEMLVVRSWLYLNLIYLFGDVPYVHLPDYRQSELMDRTKVQDITDSIVSSVRAAIDLFESVPSSAVKSRISLDAARSLLARIYLCSQNWQAAFEQADLVIASGHFKLSSTAQLAGVFTKGNQETIFEIAAPNESVPVAEAGTFIPSSISIRPTYQLRSFILETFAPEDERLKRWVSKNTVGGLDYFYPYKYKQRVITGGGSPNEYQIVFRLPELYLIRAESALNMSDLQRSLSDLNFVRARAGLQPLSSLTKESMMQEIWAEREREFFAESGFRWIDLKRTHRIDSVLAAVKGSTWQPHDSLWPLPENELLYNPNLTQNTGY